jgi:hypothetical protein
MISIKQLQDLLREYSDETYNETGQRPVLDSATIDDIILYYNLSRN